MTFEDVQEIEQRLDNVSSLSCFLPLNVSAPELRWAVLRPKKWRTGCLASHGVRFGLRLGFLHLVFHLKGLPGEQNPFFLQSVEAHCFPPECQCFVFFVASEQIAKHIDKLEEISAAFDVVLLFCYC